MIPPIFRAFWRDVRAHTSIVMAISLVPIAAVAGFALDGSRQVSLKKHVQYAVDAAVLAGARSYKTEFSTTVAETAATASFNLNIASAHGDATCDINDVSADLTDLSVAMTASCEIPTTFGAGIMGMDDVTVSADAVAAASHRIADVAMVLDLSGSMNDFELADLRAGTRRATELIIGTAAGQTSRVALVPFASGVNAGDFGNMASGRDSGDDPEDDDSGESEFTVIERVCVTERTGLDMYTDAEPVVGSYVGAVTTIRDGGRPSRGRCPDSPVLPLNDDVSTINAAIDDLARSTFDTRTGANTSGHMGIVWAWYVLSPNWLNVWTNAAFGGSPDFAPHAYGDPNRPKIVILMTDGRFDQGFQPEFTDIYDGELAASLVNDAAKTYCREMRAAGITIYAIGYNTGSDAEETLGDCAGDPSRLLTTNVSSELTGLYEQIARDFLGIGLLE